MTPPGPLAALSRLPAPLQVLARIVVLFVAVQLVQAVTVGLAMLAFGLFVLRDPGNAMALSWLVPTYGMAQLTRATLYPLVAFAIALFSRFRITALLHVGWTAAAGAFTIYKADLHLTAPALALAIGAGLAACITGYLTFRRLARVMRAQVVASAG